MGKALYRKYRSKSLDEIVGQSHITDILRQSIKKGSVAHAYLLTGPRGVGKTSIARILAHEINGLPYSDESQHLDIIEIDAASNNSVEDVRDLREKIQIAPVSANKKIYIIDEVHMLSKSAFNALLKTLEEPPEHIVFILATTDADKLPATIISRVQQFNFHSISVEDAVKHLTFITKQEGIAIDDDALQLVAIHGDGSFRDSISILDQLASGHKNTITKADVESTLGLTDSEVLATLIRSHEQHDLAAIVTTVRGAVDNGSSATTLAKQLIIYVADNVIHSPHLLPLLDRLLDVQSSNWPDMKLISVLAHSNAPQPTTTVQPVSAKQHEKTQSPPKTKAQTATAKPAVKTEVATKATVPKPVPEPTEQPIPVISPEHTVEFPWHDFLATVKVDSIGAATLLSKCGYDYDGTTLIIFAGKPFTKKQIDKALPFVQKSLQAIGIENAEISILDQPKPPADSKTAAILAMMGGGEEVSL
jgi:DNA polymerase-3 subunit gamma/tau